MFHYNEFEKCSSEWRSAPFYSLNGDLKKEILESQIEEMYKQGMGGFFMHPRAGLENEYLGKEYFDAIEICIKKAEQLNMKAWIYDEDRFPSGVAGGKVYQIDHSFASSELIFEILKGSELKKQSDEIILFCKKDFSGQFEANDAVADDEYAVFYRRVNDSHPCFNNTPYIDLCNKEAVKEFVKLTHEKYKERFAKYFGNVIPGVFTDEPDFGSRPAPTKFSYPWTPSLLNEFMKMKGYDLKPHIYKLFFDMENYQKIRVDYWDVMTELFNQSFVRYIADWCSENNLSLTGHYWDHHFPQPWLNGSVMPYYANMEIPGIDLLFKPDHFEQQFGNDFIVKEVASVANQFNRKRVLSESFGAAGWDLSFEEQKRMIDWQLVLGINLISQHLFYYSMSGYRKRDWPLSFSKQQPWWECYNILGDYIGRLSYALSQGEYISDVLVIHPAASTWAHYTPLKFTDNEKLNEIDKSTKELVKSLNSEHIQFDLGDEKIIRSNGAISDDLFCINNKQYKYVILPALSTILPSTYEMLKKFIGNGGKVVVYEKREDCSAELLELYKGLYCANGKIELLVEQMKELQLDSAPILSKADDIYIHMRKLNETQEIIFFANVYKNSANTARLYLHGLYQTYLLNCFTGEKTELEVYKDDKGFYINVCLEPTQSMLLLTDKSLTGKLAEEFKKAETKRVEPADWQINVLNDNILVIDYCEAVLNNDIKMSGNVLEVDDKFKDMLKLSLNNVFSVQPWAFGENDRNAANHLSISINFYNQITDDADICLLIENREHFALKVNNSEVVESNGFYLDESFTSFDITKLLVKGLNTIHLTSNNYNGTFGIESVYLKGKFSLIKKETGYILSDFAAPSLGDITLQGFPFYSGKIAYSTTFVAEENAKEVTLHLKEFKGMTVKVYINDEDAGQIFFMPYTLDITKYMKAGENTLRLVLMNSLQNMLGPHSESALKGIAHPLSFARMDEDFCCAGTGIEIAPYLTIL